MKRILTTLISLVLVASTSFQSPVCAQSKKTENVYRLDDPANRPEASVEQIAWLAGSWVGEGFGGSVEETWNTPTGGTMIGTFKLSHGGEPSLYEVELIAEEEGSLVWKVKHFNADFSGWEDKAEFVSFPLVKITDDAAYFDGLTLARDGEDGLKMFLTMTHEGQVGEESLTFKRLR